MIEIKLFFALISYYFVMFVTPGPNNAMLTASGIKFGFKKTIPLILGVFFGFLSVLSLCLLGIGEIYKSFPAIALILKIIAASFLTYLSFKIFTSTSFSDEKSPKKFTFKDIYFFQIINPKAVTVSMSSSAIFIQNKFPYEIEFVLIFICFVISTSTSALVWAAIGHSFRKYLNDKKKIIYFNRTMALLLLCSIFFIII